MYPLSIILLWYYLWSTHWAIGDHGPYHGGWFVQPCFVYSFAMSSANRTSCYDRRPAYRQKVRRMGPPQVTQWSEPLKPSEPLKSSEPLKAETLWECMVVGSLISAGEDFFYVPWLPVARTHYNCTLFSLTGVCSGIGCQTFHDLFTMWMHDLSRQQEPDSINWRMTPTRVVGLKKFMFPQWSALVMWLLGHIQKLIFNSKYLICDVQKRWVHPLG